MKYLIRHMETTDIDNISKLFQIIWKIDLNRIKSKTKWAFDNDFSKVLLYFYNDEIIAVRGGINWPLMVLDKEIKAIQLHGTCVHPDFRRQGIFTSINKDFLKDAIEEQNDFIFNVSVDNSRAGYEKLGWEYIKGFRRLTFFRKPFKVLFGKESIENKIIQSRTVEDLNIPTSFIDERNKRLANSIYCKYSTNFLRWRLNNESEKYKKVQTGEAIIIYKVKQNKGIKEVIIGECFLLRYKFSVFCKVLDLLYWKENPDLVYTYIFKDHPCYTFFTRKLFIPNPKRYNLNFGTKFLNEKVREEFESKKWAICYLDRSEE